MSRRVHALWRAVRRSVEAHGGGRTGLVNASLRGFKVIRALGLAGFLRRIRAASALPAATPMFVEHSFAEPAPLAELQLRVGVMAHVFYPDLIEEFAGYLDKIPVSFVLLVSVVDEAAREQALARFGMLSNLAQLHVRVVPNRGRDIAPMLVTFREEILALDVFAHIHSKKSLYTGNEQSDWRRYLLDALLGDRQRVARHLGWFQANPELGILYPESHPCIPGWAHAWLSNLQACQELGERLGIGVEANRYLDFPAGSMFWARVQALRPLFDLSLRQHDFPEEHGQTDGTLQHAVERMLVVVARRHGYVAAILPDAPAGQPQTEGQRNWSRDLQTPLSTRLQLAAIQAQRISVDVFDTLVVRPFLTPQGARAYLEHRVQRQFGLTGFADLRARAEAKSRAQTGTDVDLDRIYRTLAELPEAAKLPIDAVKALELELEQRQLQPRRAVVQAMASLPRPAPLLALSDMYLDTPTLRRILPAAVAGLPDHWQVSCETGLRKDQDALWQRLPASQNVTPASWLHIGDNEHADIQLPQRHGLATPVHVPRPSALLDLHPALRPLRPARFDQAAWADQLWLGLLANRFADDFDRSPGNWLPRPVLAPELAGYGILGPLLLDYLVWLGRLAHERSTEVLLFLSREGYLLEQAFTLIREAVPAFQSLTSRYFLTSRRASGTASLHRLDDLPRLLGGTFNGTLQGFLFARFGVAASQAVGEVLGDQALSSDLYLPEMGDALIEKLAPAANALLDVAATEREAYLEHWSRDLGESSRVMVADIGYSGSIQASLARMLRRPLEGAYWALDARATTGLEGQWAAARYHDGRDAGEAADSPILRHDLLLETLLTAPTPQFSHFEMGPHAPIPRYAPAERPPAQWQQIAQAQAGALAFIADACAAVGDDVQMLEMDRQLVQRPLECLGSGLWQAPWLASLRVEDVYTGRGQVQAH